MKKPSKGSYSYPAALDAPSDVTIDDFIDSATISTPDLTLPRLSGVALLLIDCPNP